MNGKVSKDELQKIVLSGIGFVVLLYVYFSFFLGPLTKSRANMEKGIADLQSKIASSKTELTKTANLEKQASAAIERFAALRALSPEGAPIAWFPPRLKAFFATQQIEKVAIRPESTGAFKQEELAQWTRYNWLFELPKTDFITAGSALAQLENTEPLLAVNRITMSSATTTPQLQEVSLSTSIAIAKR